MMCQCNFIDGNKCSPLVGDADSQGACMGARGKRELSVHDSFSVNLTLLFKQFIFFFKVLEHWRLFLFLMLLGTL